MRFGAVPTITTFVVAGFLACVPAPRDTGSKQGSGGATGGTSAAGGTTKTGGTTSAGGTAAGGTSAGGSTSAGGATVSGGATARGGSGDAGGASASGGTSGSGGTNASGGSSAPGGSGGAATSAGGSTGACTDIVPPNNPCSDWKSWNQCNVDYIVSGNFCNQTCGRCGGGAAGGSSGSGGSSAHGGSGGAGGTTSSGGASGGGGTPTPGSTNAQISGTNGWASRYWDCCKPSCGWTANSNPAVPSCAKDGTTRVGADGKNGCEGGGSAFECYDFSPWYDAGTNMAYGFAAYNGVACGTCFMLQFTGSANGGSSDKNGGDAKLKGQQMIVQVINIGGIQANQFDVLIPGGGVGAMNGCATQWGSSTDLGSTYGGLLSECNDDATCMKGKCSSVFGNVSSVLKAGCDWFTGWFSSADNPSLVYKQVSCPSLITSKTGLSK